MYNSSLDPIKVGKTIACFRQKKYFSGGSVWSCDIGRSHLCAIECSERKPTLETFYKICTAFDAKMIILKSEETL